MSEPEISRRCRTCGASVRQRASFCPQCGQMLGTEHTDLEADPETNATATPETQILSSPSEVTTEVSEPSAVTQTDLMLPDDLRPASVPLGAETQPLITKTIQREPTVSESDVIIPPPAEVERPGMENLKERVDRIRKVSSVVIDQAAYDPSLRFLLVAALLIILFVILMVMSKVID